MAIENINQVTSDTNMAGVAAGHAIIDEVTGKLTVLANARKLIEDKTRFELGFVDSPRNNYMG